jgi:LmbE family N-acetylglucosaminyl deacetylase
MSAARHRFASLGAGNRTRAGSQNELLRSITASAALWPDPAAFLPAAEEELPPNDNAGDRPPVKALLVNAHPDDESESAALVYRLTHELSAVVDQVVVTNGEGGHQYAALAEAYYRLPLSTAANKSELLGQIRRNELIRSSRILGIRHTCFLDQKDTGVTLNARDAFAAWDVARIRQELRLMLQFERYDLVLLLLPTQETHGHHQTLAALTLDVVEELDREDRPACIGVQTGVQIGGQTAAAWETRPLEFSELSGYPVTRTTSPKPVWSFDRRTPLSCHRSLHHSIIVNWVISEHKSQGFFQMEGSQRTHEHFWLFEVSGEAGAARWRDILGKLDQNSLPGGPRVLAQTA